MCLTCRIATGEFIPIGDIIYRDDYVILHHCVDINIPGYLILSPLTHVEAYSDLQQDDMIQMGLIMKLAVAAVQKIDGVEKVYLANFGEETTHFHMHIFPRYQWMLQDSATDICTDNKIDGAKLLSFCRGKYKTQLELMENNKILLAIEHVRRLINNLEA